MKASLIIILLLIAYPIFAQPANPSGDPDVPITGIEILLAAGGALGLRSLLARKKSKE